MIEKAEMATCARCGDVIDGPAAIIQGEWCHTECLTAQDADKAAAGTRRLAENAETNRRHQQEVLKMGLNVNLVQMLGVPSHVNCSKCGDLIVSEFDDYDIECGHPNPEARVWVLGMYCEHCQSSSTAVYYISAYQQVENQAGVNTLAIYKGIPLALTPYLSVEKTKDFVSRNTKQLDSILDKTYWHFAVDFIEVHHDKVLVHYRKGGAVLIAECPTQFIPVTAWK